MNRIELKMGGISDYSSPTIYAYRKNGLIARDELDLESKDNDDNYYEINFPENTIDATSSFIEGLFEDSIDNIDSFEEFKEKYIINLNDSVYFQIKKMYKYKYEQNKEDHKLEQMISDKNDSLKKCLPIMIMITINEIFSAITMVKGYINEDAILYLMQIPIFVFGAFIYAACILYIRNYSFIKGDDDL
jgi:hypothetical protein